MLKLSLQKFKSAVIPMVEKPKKGNRDVIYQGVARLWWAHYCIENDVAYAGLDSAPPAFKRDLLEMAEAVTNMVLSPDLRDACLMCMAEQVLKCNTGDSLTMRDVSTKTAAQYLATAEASLGAFLQNLKTIPPSLAHREEMSRLMDAVAPKKAVN